MTTKDTNPKDAVGVRKWRQFFVVPRQVMWEVGVGMLEGVLKYGRHNYRASGVRASVYCDAAMGHIDQFIEGENIDPDSGLSHITKAICSLVVLRDAMMNDFWEDDRPPKINIDFVRDELQGKVEAMFEKHADKNPHHYTERRDGSPYRFANTAEEVSAASAARFSAALEQAERDDARKPLRLGVDAGERVSGGKRWKSVLDTTGGKIPSVTVDGNIVRGWELEVGKRYRFMGHNPNLPWYRNGAVWLVKSIDADGARGVKDTYRDDHEGVPLLMNGYWRLEPDE